MLHDIEKHPQSKFDLISDVLYFFSKDFTKFYATVIEITEKLPEQINNEIRNAFSHLARANESDDIEAIKAECDKSRDHIERANRDCLKCSIITLRDRIMNKLDNATIQHTPLPPGIMQRKKSIEQERRNLLQDEARGIKGLTGRYEILLVDCINLDEELFALFGILPSDKLWKLLLFMKQQRSGFFIGIVASIIATLLLHYVIHIG